MGDLEYRNIKFLSEHSAIPHAERQWLGRVLIDFAELPLTDAVVSRISLIRARAGERSH